MYINNIRGGAPMYCMKCGREIEDGQAFCGDCLAVMEKYPVKPGTAVILPKRRRDLTVMKRPSVRRKTLTPEERILKMRRALRGWIIAWIVTFLLLCAALYPAILYIREENHFGLGQNYSVFTDTETAAD